MIHVTLTHNVQSFGLTDHFLDRKYTFPKSLSSVGYFSYPKSIPFKTPASSNVPHTAVEKRAPFPALLFLAPLASRNI